MKTRPPAPKPKAPRLAPRATMCATCPYRPGSLYAFLEPALTVSAMTDASRICHSTGNNPVIKAVNTPPLLCRGSRDMQLRAFFGMGLLTAPTDAAWEELCRKLNI